MSINMCHIAPVSYLPFVRQYSTHLLLAHLVEENKEYRDFYINLKHENPNVFYHLDNSAFEMFKRWLENLFDKGTLQLDYKSCEMIADDVANEIHKRYPDRCCIVSVAEDNENGCIKHYEV